MIRVEVGQDDGVETPHEPLIGRVLVTCPAATDGTEHVVELSGTLVP